MNERTLAHTLRTKRVLLVDDEKFSRNIIFRMLKDMGCDEDPLMASDGAAGLALLGENRHAVGLAICDFNMPVMNGLEFLKAVRTAIDGLPNTLSVVMLTGHADASLVGAALALDVDAFVLKPVSRTVLETRVKRIFGQPQGVKPPTHYAGVDVASAAKAVLRARHGIADPATAANVPLQGVPTELEAITLPAVLGADITAPTGELLLGEGVALTPRLLERLKELRAIGIVSDRVILRDSTPVAKLA